jgi:hypothetical protein
VQPTSAVVIPSLTGGWLELGRPTPAQLLDVWQRKYGYDPAADLGRAVEDGDLISSVVVQVPGSSAATPIAWAYETQRRFVLFLGSLVRLTFHFPQHASFIDPAGRVSIEAEAYRQPSERPYRRVHVRLHARVSSPLRGGVLEADFDFRQRDLVTVVSSCCAVFPALGQAELLVALD